MKIKVNPEDFFVEEVLDQPAAHKGTFGLYVLEKKNKNTVELLLEISERLRISFSDLGYGGRKDKHAFTRQYITIRNNKKPFNIKEKNWALNHVGFLDRQMGPDLIKANRFYIILRDLKQDVLCTAQAELAKVKKDGFANYFDDQRFGTFDATQGFLADKILKKHFNGALKIYMTHLSSADNREERERKLFFYENWGNWPACLQRSTGQFARLIFTHLSEKPKDFILLLRKIPSHELTLHFSAYQGYLWNEVLRRFMNTRIAGPLIHKGIAGDYVFFNTLDPETRNYWSGLTIPTAASKMKISDDEIGKITKKVFEDNLLTTPMFNITKIRQAYFKSTERKVVVIPDSLTTEAGDDEVYPGSKKLCLGFSLTRGSYATMLIKRLFATHPA